MYSCARRFNDDIEWMTGQRPNIYWQVTWRFISPLMLLVVFLAYVVIEAEQQPTYNAWNPDYVRILQLFQNSNTLFVESTVARNLKVIVFAPHQPYRWTFPLLMFSPTLSGFMQSVCSSLLFLLSPSPLWLSTNSWAS